MILRMTVTAWDGKEHAGSNCHGVDGHLASLWRAGVPKLPLDREEVLVITLHVVGSLLAQCGDDVTLAELSDAQRDALSRMSRDHRCIDVC